MKFQIHILINLCLFLGFSQIAFAQVSKKVLVEKFTSSNCGNCPDGTAILTNITANEPDIIWVSIHAGWINDPMNFPTIDSIANAFTSGAPKANVDRVRFAGASEVALLKTQWQANIDQQLNKATNVEVTVTGTRNANQETQITVNTKFLATPNSDDYRVNLYVVEDSLVGSGNNWNQANYFNNTSGHYYQGAGNPIVNYPHRHVVRAVPSHAWGTSGVIPNSPMMNIDYSKTYNYTIPQDFDLNKVRFVAFISTYNSDVNQRTVLNANQVSYNDLSITLNSTNKNTLPATITIAPNPVQTQLNLQIKSDENLGNSTIEVVDIMGRKIKMMQDVLISKEANNISLNVANLNNGIYFLQIRNGVKITTKRFVIQK